VLNNNLEKFLRDKKSGFLNAEVLRQQPKVHILKPELKPTLQRRSLKAFLDLAILCALTNQPITAYGINILFMNKLGIMVSPSMIYTNLSSMERKGLIRCVRNRTGRAYALTEQGKEIAENINCLTDQIRTFTFNLQKLKTNL